MRIPVSKLRRPGLGVSVIDRTWLFEQQPAASSGSAAGPQERGGGVVTALCAPAGAGKTTLMATWAEKCALRRERVAWLTLDAKDDDLVLFWTGLLTAATHATDDGPDAPVGVEIDDVRDALRGHRGPLLRLEEVAAASEAPLWLFLDDVHEIGSAAVLAELDDLIRNVPPGIHLVLASRRDPPVGLHRLRLAGRLREIRAAELALDRSEVRRVLDDHGVVLDDAGLRLLVARTEGWAAGVRLAALRLSTAEDPSSVVRDLAADDHAVADFLTAEILRHLDEPARRLLRACAVPEQVTADLVVALTGDPSQLPLLEGLHRDNILVTLLAQPGGWYRLHSMLRGYLLADLRRTEPALLAALHATAAHWFADHGYSLWAVTHAIESQDAALCARMLAALGPSLLAEGRAPALRSLIAGATAAVRSDPQVAQLDVLAAMEIEQQRPPTLSTSLQESLTDLGRVGEEESSALSGLVALQAARYVDRRLSGGALAASRAIPGVRYDDLGLLVRLSRGTVLASTMQLDQADVELADAYRMVRPGKEHARLQILTAMAGVASCRCDFRRTGELAEQALHVAAEIGETSTPAGAFAGLQAAHAAYQRLDCEAARRLAEPALSRGLAEPTVQMAAHALIATLDVDAGHDPFGATRRLRDCWAIGAGQPTAAVTAIRLAFAQHRCGWLVGRPDWAREALRHLGQAVGEGGDRELLEVMEQLARGRAVPARRRLGRVLTGTVPCQLPVSLQQAWLIEAVLAGAAGEEANSFAALTQALELADETAAWRAFVDVPGVLDLLDESASRFGRLADLAEEIRTKGRAEAHQELVPLTPKELQLLMEFPAQLTLEEIAERHQVSVNTVKTHARSIYQKLSATSRREAITIARRRGVL